MRLTLLALLAIASPAIAQPPPPLVAPTDAQSPADERKGFTVPAGFEVQLVASEPDIQKPMQMAFDAKGRLWVTTSYHYPFAAPQGKGTDKLFVLSDIDPETGKAKKVQVFADDLNIPIGILPLPDCKSCLVSSTGEIRKYTDTNDDGKADKMEVLFTGFGFRDTHGMYNSFTLMPDGWVYACHGYLNTSKVKGKDGHEVEMNSGHTFRFRPDGSRIEVYTRGQVNPFGIAVDPWFNLYTADCHSKPITQLIPGAYYDSFGKPHDGLGYGPHVTRHDHGSTGLCGLAWYDADQFPNEYVGCMFVGNVVTSRINFDKIEWRGSSPVAKELPDFLTSKDLWFRPVDIKLGPDGALYVADFYNKIIGHYEVDLKHPGRDKDHGRLWRIVWKGKDAKPAKMAFTDLTKEKPENLVRYLASPNLMVRMMATEEACHRNKEMMALLADVNGSAVAHAPWVLVRTGSITLPELAVTALLERDTKKLLATTKLLTDRREAARKVADKIALLSQGNAPNPIPGDLDSYQVLRAMVDLTAAHPHADFVAPLVELIKKIPAEDTHLRLAARIALRNCLRDLAEWPKESDPIYGDIALAIPNGKAASLLLFQIERKSTPDDKLAAAAEHVARYGTERDQESLFDSLTSYRPNADPILGAFRGLQARGMKLTDPVTKHLLERAQSSMTTSDVLSDTPYPDDMNVKKFLWGTRILTVLPAVLDRSQVTNRYMLNPGTTKLLGTVLSHAKASVDTRTAAAEVLLQYAPDDALKVIREQIGKGDLPASVRDRFLLVFAASSHREARLDARDALKDAPYRTAVSIGTALAGTPFGAEDLLGAIKQGKAPTRLLQEKAILERLRAAKIPDLEKQIGELTKGLPPLDQKIAEVMKKRATAFASAKPDKELGAKLFTKHCAACHRIGDAGGKIAPQLDGVGTRGLERLLEDTLDPNRNVDQAFRARIITTKDERTITGLMLRVEGEVLVIADDQGKEIRIPTKDIDKNRETMLSPMPANFAEAMPEAEFQHLMAYLLDQKAKEPKK